MRSILISLLLLLGAAHAKDNFIYHEDVDKQKKQIEKIEQEIVALKQAQDALGSGAQLAKANQTATEQNAKKIASAAYKQRTADKKIAEFEKELSALKTAMRTMKSSSEPSVAQPAAEQDVAVDAVVSENVASKEDLGRTNVQLEGLMDRVTILETQMSNMKKQPNPLKGIAQTTPQASQDGTLTEVRTALYEYFEYYVIVTVILFFLMFIIIFSLVSKTRHLQLVTNELLNRD